MTTPSPCGAMQPFALDETSGPVAAYVCELPAGHESSHHAKDITVPCPPIDDEERTVFAEGGYERLVPWRAEQATSRWKASRAAPPTGSGAGARPGEETEKP